MCYVIDHASEECIIEGLCRLLYRLIVLRMDIYTFGVSRNTSNAKGTGKFGPEYSNMDVGDRNATYVEGHTYSLCSVLHMV